MPNLVVLDACESESRNIDFVVKTKTDTEVRTCSMIVQQQYSTVVVVVLIGYSHSYNSSSTTY